MQELKKEAKDEYLFRKARALFLSKKLVHITFNSKQRNGAYVWERGIISQMPSQEGFILEYTEIGKIKNGVSTGNYSFSEVKYISEMLPKEEVKNQK